MSSPFPGMDPYLEQHWSDVHASLCTYARDALRPQIGPALRARVSAPSQVHLQDAVALTPITVIHFITPSDKTSDDRAAAYRQSRKRAIDAGVNWVEIDLLRGRAWVLMAPQIDLPSGARKDYTACICRAAHPGRVEFYPMSLRNRLPTLPVPLKPGIADAALDLQQLINQAHTAGGYAYTDYSVQPVPPLEDADWQWAGDLAADPGQR